IINKCGSHSTVVWNPWQETASKMGDLGEEGYKKMLCVESSNAAEDVVTIKPGKAHHLWVQYEVQKK
ncbi:MAG: D-hexose-6-phosphate mutarotase, partial [Gammaproteobacteria bacterium]|nr:D-hexose-6-phosphate mutarotase [Gammaproteobacteria bacterium]